MDPLSDTLDMFIPACHNHIVINPPQMGFIKPVDVTDSARKRPVMYVGGIGETGLYRMLCGILDYLIRSSASYQDTHISLSLSNEKVIVNSSLPSYQIELDERLSLLVAAALSKRFSITVTACGQGVCRSFEKGILTGETRFTCHKEPSLTIQLTPDTDIFTSCNTDPFIFYERCFVLAALYPGIHIELVSKGQHNQFCFSDGIGRLLKRIDANLIGDGEDTILTFAREGDGITLRGALRRSWFPHKAVSYANGMQTLDGGTHVTGFLLGMKRLLTKLGKQIESDMDAYIKDHFEYAIAIWLDNPTYAGGVKLKLLNEELIEFIADAVECMELNI